MDSDIPRTKVAQLERKARFVTSASRVTKVSLRISSPRLTRAAWSSRDWRKREMAVRRL